MQQSVAKAEVQLRAQSEEGEQAQIHMTQVFAGYNEQLPIKAPAVQVSPEGRIMASQ
jgi:hypothetical protein